MKTAVIVLMMVALDCAGRPTPATPEATASLCACRALCAGRLSMGTDLCWPHRCGTLHMHEGGDAMNPLPCPICEKGVILERCGPPFGFNCSRQYAKRNPCGFEGGDCDSEAEFQAYVDRYRTEHPPGWRPDVILVLRFTPEEGDAMRLVSGTRRGAVERWAVRTLRKVAAESGRRVAAEEPLRLPDPSP